MSQQLLLNYISKYISLSKEEEAIFLSKISFRKYLKGQYLVQQGDICRFTNFVVSGCTRTFLVDDKGQEHIIMFGIEDWWVSDIGSFITQTPADYNVQCLENTSVYQFSYEDQEAMFESIPKLERLFRKLLERHLVSSQKRIVRGLSLNAKQQYQYFKDQYPNIEQRVPQYMIASYLGITKEFLSKLKKQLLQE
ncbi:Crp/Fnr family transcriptional regulator [Cognatitamlana onchidii]|uniref:Crp/Fnr family transcriptional regulator n=1 Tax=Cognatitamlana onchidii TaxID=2562860 RepID=UPI0010A667FB|nr:Crp/Fnr family transcriptional regulator [Algibacter onchidii]